MIETLSGKISLSIHTDGLTITPFILGGSLSAFQNFSRNLPLLRSLSLLAPDLTNPHIGRLFTSAPLLQDLTFDRTIVMWRELSRAMPLSQLVKISVKVTMYKLDDASFRFLRLREGSYHVGAWSFPFLMRRIMLSRHLHRPIHSSFPPSS